MQRSISGTEQAARDQYEQMQRSINKWAERYSEELQRVADLAPVLDHFFDKVLVMAKEEDLRSNRIALLQKIDREISRTARLTEMVVDKAEARAKAG